MIKLATKPNANGNTKQLIIDNDNKTIKSGYFLFVGGGDISATIAQLKAVENAFLKDGYKLIK